MTRKCGHPFVMRHFPAIASHQNQILLNIEHLNFVCAARRNTFTTECSLIDDERALEWQQCLRNVFKYCERTNHSFVSTSLLPGIGVVDVEIQRQLVNALHVRPSTTKCTAVAPRPTQTALQALYSRARDSPKHYWNEF